MAYQRRLVSVEFQKIKHKKTGVLETTGVSFNPDDYIKLIEVDDNDQPLMRLGNCVDAFSVRIKNVIAVNTYKSSSLLEVETHFDDDISGCCPPKHY